MKIVGLHSEAFGAMGNVVSEGIWNQLGRPELDRLALLLRESVQNSWDARKSESIDYSVQAFTLDEQQRESYREFFADSPPPAAYRTGSSVAEQISDLRDWLRSACPRLLVVSDRGTSGLDGPIRADAPTGAHEERNFVNFLRNVGQPPSREQGGGTFGYGKAAFYLASETRTIVVYTHCRHDGGLTQRLTAAALTHHFEHEGTRFTGRHWWGHLGGSLAEPLTGALADDWARKLGLPGFNGAQTGTSIAITAPVFSDEALSELPWLCLRNLWPKLKAEGKGKPPISVLLRVSGHSLQVPDPSTTPPYDGYWRALTELRQGRGETITYYKETTGSLAIQHTVRSNKYQDDPRRAEHEQRPQHIALLRAPELVVKYLDGGRSLAAENIGFTGVFKADQHADHAFALAEPPTHDDWQAASVRDKRYRGIVNQTLKKIRQHVRDFVAPHSTPATPANGSSLASLSNQFAELLPGLIGSEAANAATRAEPEEPVAGKRQRRARPHVRIQPDQEVLDIEGKPYIVFRMDITHAKDSECTRVSADVYPVVSGGAREGDPPRGASVPRVAWWESPRGAKLEGDSIVVGPRQQGSWSLYVPVVDANAVALELRASSGEAE